MIDYRDAPASLFVITVLLDSQCAQESASCQQIMDRLWQFCQVRQCLPMIDMSVSIAAVLTGTVSHLEYLSGYTRIPICNPTLKVIDEQFDDLASSEKPPILQRRRKTSVKLIVIWRSSNSRHWCVHHLEVSATAI